MDTQPTPAYILVGMMGAGKSAVGRRVAELSDRPYIDTDSTVVRRVGRTIPQIFKIYGEDAFREHESAALRSFDPSAIVLATGGGIVLREQNWTEMRRCGIILYLKADPSVLARRLELSRRKRPLLEGENWQQRLREIAEQREQYYQKADGVLCLADETVEEAADRALEKFLELSHQFGS